MPWVGESDISDKPQRGEIDPGRPPIAPFQGSDTQSTATVLGRCPRLPYAAPLGLNGWLAAGHFPVGFDLFRVEWERAAWNNAGDPAGEERAKRQLICWRLQALLAELTGDSDHAYEAVAARPDLPTHCAAVRVSPEASVTWMLPRKRIT